MPTNSFTNEAIDLETLPKYEEIPLNNPHSNYWNIICINFFICFVIGGIVVGLGVSFIDEFKPNAILLSALYLSFMILLFIILRASFKKRGYAIRTRDVIYKSGIIAESTTIVPLNRIQHIELNEGIFSRMYKLGSLQIFTAGGQTGHVKISGIPIDEAKSIRDLLLSKLDLIQNPIKDAE
ncbi:PH domain-containing protein [Pedobacter frigidisoli]|uniref:PH domain-containing protein n=1 Tax=Pedobacter frigidisoli TaxID=2530455 RepID=A0A4R0NZ58_9SPHI|nr:PH domain-containing protein [Pedobacter frigidisoli]TCD05664.1 PH domain-containing protein [Pedobacter frigidisoli]